MNTFAWRQLGVVLLYSIPSFLPEWQLNNRCQCLQCLSPYLIVTVHAKHEWLSCKAWVWLSFFMRCLPFSPHDRFAIIWLAFILWPVLELVFIHLSAVMLAHSMWSDWVFGVVDYVIALLNTCPSIHVSFSGWLRWHSLLIFSRLHPRGLLHHDLWPLRTVIRIVMTVAAVVMVVIQLWLQI